jgi:hypothetical protein
MNAGAPAIRARVLGLLSQRAAASSICPSEVARALAPQEPANGPLGWRALMEPVRDQARHMAREGLVVITQGQQALSPDEPFEGPIRLRRGPGFCVPGTT